MKLNTKTYKLSLYTESVCPGCQELKQKLSEIGIPYTDKCITVDITTDKKGENVDNRWDFIDDSREYPDKIKFTPVMIIEDINGNKEYLGSGAAFETTEEAVKLLEQYCN